MAAAAAPPGWPRDTLLHEGVDLQRGQEFRHAAIELRLDGLVRKLADVLAEDARLAPSSP